MEPLILFGIGRILYSLIGRRDKWFIVLEVIASVIFFSVGLILISIKQDAIRGVSICILFIITGLLSRFILPKHPFTGQSVDAGSKEIKHVGIIDFVWIFIMGGTIAIIAFAKEVPPFTVTIKEGMNPEYYKSLFDMVEFLLGKTIDSVFLLGGVLAACMTILWAGGIWRRIEEADMKQYKFTTISAIKMVVAYFIVILNALVWVAIPLYQKMNELTEVLK